VDQEKPPGKLSVYQSHEVIKNAERVELCKKLGYKEPVAVTDTEGAVSAAAPRGVATPTLQDAVGCARDAAELPLLEWDELQQLKAPLDADPEAVMTWA
jgi:hypothetical protein